MPLSSRLLTDEQLRLEEPSYPLELVLCPGCSLVQIVPAVPPEELAASPVYFASSSESALRAARQLTSRIMASQKLRPTSLAVEIGSNDGYLLRNYLATSIPVLGIEPAVHVADVARREHRVPTLCRSFDSRLANQLAGCSQLADVVHVHRVLACAADPNDFVTGLRSLLQSTGVAVIDAPYVKDLVDNVEVDTIHHEHLFYYSLTSLSALLARQGLVVHDVERIAADGGSLRIYVGKSGLSSWRVRKLLDEERGWGVDRAAFYASLGQRVERLRQDLVALLRRLKADGHRIAGYGASAEGSALLNCFKIGPDMVDFVVDRNTSMQGRYTPGTHLKVHSPEKLVEDNPDYVLLLNRNAADEILAQQAEYRQRGGRFIIPIPSVKVA
jgi:hypothetical protein